jgi:hypothetical protein
MVHERRYGGKGTNAMTNGKNGLFLALALLVLGIVIALLYRSASHDELPDDEWLDFEHSE